MVYYGIKIDCKINQWDCSINLVYEIDDLARNEVNFYLFNI